MVKLKFIAPPEPSFKFSANVHTNGRMGFTLATAKHFKIDNTKSLQLAVNEDDKTDTNIYAVLLDKVDEQNAYKIKKNGAYHSVLSKGFFDAIGINYTEGNISYSITEDEIDGKKVIKFSRRNKQKVK